MQNQSVPGFTVVCGLLVLGVLLSACSEDAGGDAAGTCSFVAGDPAQASNFDVTALTLDSDGTRLWIGTADSGLFEVALNGDSATPHTTNDGLASNSIETIYSDSKGRVWVGHGRASCPDTASGHCGFSVFEQSAWSTAQGQLDSRIFALGEDSNGTLWAGTHQGAMSSPNGTQWDAYFDWQDCNNPGDHCDALFSFTVGDLAFDGAGDVWLAIDQMTLGVSPKPGGVARRSSDGRTDTWDRDDMLPSNRASSIALLDGVPWAGSPVGLASLDIATQTWRTELELPVADVAAQSGSVLWAATDTGAHKRDASGAWEQWTTAEGLPDDAVRAVVSAGEWTCLGTSKGVGCYRSDTCAWFYP